MTSLWVEVYRPRTIQDCVLPKSIKSVFSGFVESGECPSLLLCGGAGTGKTTAARALANEMGMQVMLINCSKENGIDAVRTTMEEYCGTVSATHDRKMLILDEADHLTMNAQAALRGFIEQYHQTVFVMTCNYKTKIIEPLHSRCAVIEYKISKKETPEMMMSLYKRCVTILQENNVEFDAKTVQHIVAKYAPDNRRVINELQRFGQSGNIGPEVLQELGSVSVLKLVEAMKSKSFKEVRQWAAENCDEGTIVYGELYEAFYEYLEPTSLPEAITILAEGQYRAQVATNRELQLMATLCELVGAVDFK